MTKQEQQERSAQIRIQALELAARIKPNTVYVDSPELPGKFNLISEAKKIEKYIKTGK